MTQFKLLKSGACIALGMLALATSAFATPVYKSADFSGGLFSVVSTFKTNLTDAEFDASLFNCHNCANPTSVTGHLIFDSSLPIKPSGYDNSFSIGAIPYVANAAIFEINIGGISLHLGDSGVQGGPAIQYKNGVYNGLFFVDDFSSPNGTQLRFSVQGSAFSLYRTSDNQNLLTGYLNIGRNGLTNIQAFTAPVPEPETYAMMMLGLGLVGAIARRRKNQQA